MDQQEFETFEVAGGRPILGWTRGVPMDDRAREQLERTARLPFVHGHVAVMPDVHVGIGATVGSVVAMRGAIVPAAVGVDIGCGMMAVQTTLMAADLPDSLAALRSELEKAVPHGFMTVRKHSVRGCWARTPTAALERWLPLARRHEAIVARHPAVAEKAAPETQMGTLGGGNHFLEVCLDGEQRVWVMLHSGSRGIGNRIGQHFIALARDDMARRGIDLPDRDLAWFDEGTALFNDYIEAMGWAQDYAARNREVMMEHALAVLARVVRPFDRGALAVNCHHNYVAREHHFGADCLVTRKGAVRAGRGELGIIPGSMGARSFIVRGLGNPHSFESCSHGAGRVMSRTEARRRFTVAEHAAATEGVECRKDEGVLDETPAAYKDIDAVMAAQRGLVEVVATLKQVLCVKG